MQVSQQEKVQQLNYIDAYKREGQPLPYVFTICGQQSYACPYNTLHKQYLGNKKNSRKIARVFVFVKVCK